MLTRDVPQWVQQSFIRSAKAAGATVSTEELVACYEKLVQLWSAPDRHHHDIRHLLDILHRVDTMAPETPHADWVRLAAWFHGIVFSTSDLAVYTRNGGEDELASAKVAEDYLTRLGVEAAVVHSVAKLIVGLKNGHAPGESRTASANTGTSHAETANQHAAGSHAAAQAHDTNSEHLSEPRPSEPRPDETAAIEMIDMDQLALRDAHLGSLAVEPQKYRHYLSDLQAEYAHIPFSHFLFARAQIVGKLLARKKLFYSPLAVQWEQPARENLEAEAERLKAKLAELSAVPVAEKKHEMDEAAAEAAHHVPETIAEAESADEVDAAALREQMLVDDAIAAASTPAHSSEPVAPRSSLEKLDDMFSPGPAPKKNLTPEQAEREARRKTAEQAWEAIEAKNKA